MVLSFRAVVGRSAMRILVTGGAGFIGSHVVDAYIRAGHDVGVLDDLSRGKRENINPEASFTRMDLRSPDLKDFLAENQFDCINHHAAQIDVRLSISDPVRDAMINVVGTLNLLEAARLTGTRTIIFASTGGAIYGAQRRFPATEEHPTAPMNPYGVAKRSIEHYLEYYRQIHALRYVVLRYANVYGPRQDPQGEAGVVGIFCQQVLGRRRFVIYGDGEQTRDYVYVGDVARASVLAFEHLRKPLAFSVRADNGQRAAGSSLPPNRVNAATHPGNNCGVFNIGTGVETSVNALAATLLDSIGADCPIVYQPSRPGEQLRSCIDPSKAGEVLGWSPVTPLPEGLTETFAWFRRQNESRSRVLVSAGAVLRQDTPGNRR
jgi:UDP-glucose 4-epimerase